jgi:hypothetical protein
MRGFAKRQGLRSLPYLGFYRESQEPVFGFVPAGARLKAVRPTITILLANKGAQFQADPNGLIKVKEVVAA